MNTAVELLTQRMQTLENDIVTSFDRTMAANQKIALDLKRLPKGLSASEQKEVGRIVARMANLTTYLAVCQHVFEMAQKLKG
jgi:hypothetical protein